VGTLAPTVRKKYLRDQFFSVEFSSFMINSPGFLSTSPWCAHTFKDSHIAG
jgi:hypothetical protein